MKFFRITLPASLFSVLLAGCVDADKEVASSPDVYWQPVQSAIPAQPLMLPAVSGASTQGELSLPALVDIALSNNPTTRQAWYGAKAAAASLGETNSQYYPQITVNGTVDRDKTRSVGFNGQTFGALTTYSNFYGPSIEMNYLLWNFGKNYAQTEAARQTLYAANYLYNQQIEDVILGTQLAYFNYNAAQGFVEAAQATLDDANTNYKAASTRLNVAQLGTKQEERQAFAQVKNAEYQLEQSQAQVETTRAQLAQTLGIPVTSNLQIVRNLSLPDTNKIDDDVSSLMAAAMRQRPDLMAAYADLLTAKYNVEAAKDDRWPTVTAVASATYGQYSAGNTVGNPYNNYMVGIQLSWQIFTGFEKTYAILNAKDREYAARETLRAQELKVVTDVWSFFYSYKSALNQVESTAAQIDAQEEAYKAIRSGYDAGLNSYVDLETSLNNLATARQQKVQAEANLGTAIANLAHSTGNLPLPSSVQQK